MSSDPEVIVPVVIDTNTMVPSLFRETHIFNFILTGNLVLIWNDFIYQEVKEVSERLFNSIYYKATQANDFRQGLQDA